MKLSTLSRTKVCAAIAVAFCTLPAFAQVEAKLTGRVHYDMRSIDSGLPGVTDKDSASVASNYEIRRARIGFVGSINKDLQFEGVANAVGSNANLIDTAFINYGYKQEAQIRTGRFKQPFSLEEITSSNAIDFMERSYVNQLVPQKKLGAMVHGVTDSGITYGASVFQNDFNEFSNSNPAGTMGAARATANLAKLSGFGGDDTVIHLGVGVVSGKYEQLATATNDTGRAADTAARSTIVSFRDENRGLPNAYRLQIGGDTLATATYGGVGNNVPTITQNMQGFELAAANGPFKFQSEYASSKFGARSLKCTLSCATSTGTAEIKATATASYFSVLWNITGENFAKSYSKGAWGAIKPNEDFMKDYGGVVGNGMGAWQVAYRWSQYSVTLNDANPLAANYSASPDVTQKTITDGSTGGSSSRAQNSASANTQTIGLNWILSQNARVMLNYSVTKFDTPVEYLDTRGNDNTVTTERVIGLRTQINF